MAKATFGAGWFWGVEAAFRSVEGVTDASLRISAGAEAVAKDALEQVTQLRQQVDLLEKFNSYLFTRLLLNDTLAVYLPDAGDGRQQVIDAWVSSLAELQELDVSQDDYDERATDIRSRGIEAIGGAPTKGLPGSS